MKITVLGAGTCLPVSGYSAPGYIAHTDDVTLLLDAGPGTLARMTEHGIDYHNLNHVVISHLHPDHTLDLLTLIQALGATPGWQRSDDLTLIGCEGLQDFIAAQLKLYKDIDPETYSIRVIEISDEILSFANVRLASAHTMHTNNSLAYRIEAEEKAVVYTGDVADPERLVDLCMNADLLICECSFPFGFDSTDHLDADQVGRLARASSVKRLLLTHLYPAAIEADIVKQVRKHFDGQVEKASDGMVVEV